MTFMRAEQEKPDLDRIGQIEREKVNYQRKHDRDRIEQIEREKAKKQDQDRNNDRERRTPD